MVGPCLARYCHIFINAILFLLIHSHQVQGRQETPGRSWQADSNGMLDDVPELITFFEDCDESTVASLEALFETGIESIENNKTLKIAPGHRRSAAETPQARPAVEVKPRRRNRRLETSPRKELLSDEEVRVQVRRLTGQLVEELYQMDRIPEVRYEYLSGLQADLIDLSDTDEESAAKYARLVQRLHEQIPCLYTQPVKSEALVSKAKSRLLSEEPPGVPQMHVGAKSVAEYHDPAEYGLFRTFEDLERAGAAYDPDPAKAYGLDDPHFHQQWYMGGKAEGQPHGANILSALALIYNKGDGTRDLSHVTDLPKTTSVVVVDMGCGYNDDLVYDATHPKCDEELTTEGLESHGEEAGDELHLGDVPICGQDHLPNESGDGDSAYFDDHTDHGTNTNSIIGAGFNDGVGIAGLCPTCRVKCIKMSSTEPNGDASVNMKGIFRSLDWIALHHDSYPISLHSYGSFFYSEVEYEAHKRLADLGHIAVVAAGNTGCDIDPLAAEFNLLDDPSASVGFNNCRDGSGVASQPFMPTSVTLDTKVDVASIGRDGRLSPFSNYGKHVVDIAAPGETIVALKATTDLTEEEKADPNKQLSVSNGTSFAAPIVAAGMALVRERMIDNCHASDDGFLHGAKVVDHLLNNSTVYEEFKDVIKGGKVLNVGRAVASVEDLC